jgi:site-specific recombinase XerD
MQKINVPKTAQQVLAAMESVNGNKETLQRYRKQGFGTIIRVLGDNTVSCLELDEFIHGQRQSFEEGQISRDRWEVIRRSAELLKFFSKTNSIDMPRLPEWEFINNPLYVGPSGELLVNPDNIYGLLWRTRQALSTTGLAEATLQIYDYGFNKLLREYVKANQSTYSHSLSQKILNEMYEQHRTGKVPKFRFNYLRKTVWIIENYRLTGEINLDAVPRWQRRELTEEYGRLLDKFTEEIKHSGNWSKETLRNRIGCTKRFLFQLEDNNITSLENITMRALNAIITKHAAQYTGGLSSVIAGVRAFFKCLHKLRLTDIDLSVSIPEFIATRRNYLKGFSPEETNKLLSVPDTNTPLGKRNYAIMILAVQTGLRAVDIVNLKRSDIDWREQKIRIVQHKTGKALCIPLEAESGNAISDYLLNARPKCDISNIFVAHKGIRLATSRPLSSTAVSTFVHGYVITAGIDASNSKRRAFHGFRRGFGTRLLEAETPLELLQQMMGQSEVDSLVPYLATEEQGLKKCALPLIGIKIGGDSQ